MYTGEEYGLPAAKRPRVAGAAIEAAAHSRIGEHDGMVRSGRCGEQAHAVGVDEGGGGEDCAANSAGRGGGRVGEGDDGGTATRGTATRSAVGARPCSWREDDGRQIEAGWACIISACPLGLADLDHDARSSSHRWVEVEAGSCELLRYRRARAQRGLHCFEFDAKAAYLNLPSA